MIEKRTVIDQIEATRSGILFLKLQKQIVEDGRVLGSEPHRTPIEPGVSLDAQMRAVNAHLLQMGYAAVEPAEVERARRLVDAEHTPGVVAAYREFSQAADSFRAKELAANKLAAGKAPLPQIEAAQAEARAAQEEAARKQQHLADIVRRGG